MAIKPIEILINAKDNASSVFSSLQGKVAAVGTAIAAYFGVSAFVGVVKGAADLETAMSRVQAATGASADEMASLRKAAEEAGANTKFTSTEAAAALENLAKAGLSASDSIAALPAVLQLAQAGDIDLATASEFVTKAVMGMGLAFTDAGRVADVLAMGANATNTSVTGLAQALSYAAPVAQSLGLSLESTVAIIGKFADAGIDASRAGTALNSILSQFANPASKFREELGAAGITTGNFEDALHQLAAAGPAGSKAINAVGQEAGPALRALLNQGMGALDDLTGKLKNAEGSAAAAAKVMSDNLNGALDGLSSAWDTVKNALGTPVLPVLKDGVDQLAGALKSAVADGTVTKFGEAIATAFQSGIKWVREFVGQIDFTQVAADLRAFADRAGEVFSSIGESARSAGAVVQTAYGVIQTSGNALLTGLYGTATGLTLVIQGVLKGLEMLYLASSKVTFGDVSRQYAAIAADLKIQSDGMGAAVDALGAKVRASMGGVVDGVGNAVGGVAKLTSTVGGASKATEDWEKTVADANAELKKGAEAAAKAGAAYQKKANDELLAKQSSEQHASAIATLREEYAALIAKGDLQAAAVKITEINKALAGTPAAAKDSGKAAEDAALKIQAAFDALGVTSSAALAEAATKAQASYEIIKTSGTATARDIGEAFKVAADKAIAANNGISPSWVSAEAATRGYKVEVDAAGKATLELANNVSTASSAHKSAVGAVGGHAASLRDLAAAYSDAGARALAAQGQFLAASAAQQTADRNKSIEDSKYMNLGNTASQDLVPTFNSLAEAEAWREEWSKQYFKENNNVFRTGGQLGTYMKDLTMFEFEAEKKALALRDAMKNANGGTTPASTTSTPTYGTNTTTVNISLGGTTRSINTDAAGADALQELLRQLAAAKSTAQ